VQYPGPDSGGSFVLHREATSCRRHAALSLTIMRVSGGYSTARWPVALSGAVASKSANQANTSPARSGLQGVLPSSVNKMPRGNHPARRWQVGSWYSARSTGAWCARASCAAARHSRCATTGDSRARLTGSPSSSGSSRSSRCTWCGRSARITRVHLARPSTACASAGWRASSGPACTSSTAATRATTLGEGTRRDSENESNAHRQNASTFDHFVGFLRFAPARDKLRTRDTVPAICAFD
jgi:hypothetical protein